MNITRSVRAQLLAQGGLYIVMLLLLAMLLAWVAREYRAEWDVTANARNTLSQGTQEALKRMDGPVNVTAYAVAKDTDGTDVHQLLRERLRQWQRYKADLTVTMVDPRDDPKRANAAGLKSPNELVIEHKGRTEHLPLETLSEQNLLNALVRLSRAQDSVVYWLDGHGERKLDGGANHDLGEFGRELRAKGYRPLALNLAIAQAVPRNAALLIIASPQTDLQDAEVAKIKAYVEGGGNLLWLIDPEPLRGLEPIAELLGLVLSAGTVVDPALKPRGGGPPTLAVGANYAPHPVTSGFRLNTLFPGSRQIAMVEREGWRATPLIEVAQNGWLETGKLDAKPGFDEARDVRGPINIASAFERTLNDRPQRVVVVGNGNFLANAFLGNGGNLQLGTAITSWLSGDDNLITLPPRPAADARIDIDQTLLYLIVFVFLITLPLLFAATGIVVWWRRRRAV
ncbi:MAG: ABC transporter [Betaproteobacteria bacterium]|nr:ABC transporter [Betaproteobacteria bacterium]